MIYFAATNSGGIDWVSILVPAVTGLVTAVLGTMALLSKYREKVDQLEKVDSQRRLSGLEGRFDALQNQVNTLQQNSPSNFVQSHSPQTLTPNGLALLDDSGIKSYVDDKFANLLDSVQKMLSEKGEGYSAYDVQEVSLDVVKDQANKKAFIPVKDYAFGKGIELTNIQLVGGIYLRDKCLESLGFDIKAYYDSDDDGHEHKRAKVS